MAYGRMAALYDRLMADMPYDRWLQLTACLTERRFGRRSLAIADLGCGTGSIAIPLARQGHKVAGIDLSAEMLSIAARKWDTARHEPGAGTAVWLEQDMRLWTLSEQTDLAISYCDCMNYLLREEDVREVIHKTWEGLNTGGLFLFDMLTERQYEEYGRYQPFMLDEDDLAYIWTCEWEPEDQIIRHDLAVFAVESLCGQYSRPTSLPASQTLDKEPRYIRVDETHRQRAYSDDWVRQELKKAGFTEIEAFGGFSMGPVTTRTKRIIYAAVK